MRENKKIHTNAVMRVSYCDKDDLEKKMKPKSLKLGAESVLKKLFEVFVYA